MKEETTIKIPNHLIIILYNKISAHNKNIIVPSHSSMQDAEERELSTQSPALAPKQDPD